MFNFFSTKKRKKRQLALEYIAIFTSLITNEVEDEPFSVESKKALIYGLMLTGAIDAICQAFDQDDLTWAMGIKFAISELHFPEEFSAYITLLHQKLDCCDEAYQVIIEGGKIAQRWMSNKLSLSSLLFEISPFLEPFLLNDEIPDSIGEILVKNKLI